MDTDQATHLHAGPQAANPPLFLAAILIAVSLAAPILFSLAGAPNLWLAFASCALALAGIITLFGAIAGQRKFRADAAIRRRASISATGIIFYRQPAAPAPETFPRASISRVWLTGTALMLETTPDHPKPGRHRLGFGKLASPRAELTAAVNALNQAITEAAKPATRP
jgi:hypothetical protein